MSNIVELIQAIKGVLKMASESHCELYDLSTYKDLASDLGSEKLSYLVTLDKFANSTLLATGERTTIAKGWESKTWKEVIETVSYPFYDIRSKLNIDYEVVDSKKVYFLMITQNNQSTKDVYVI